MNDTSFSLNKEVLFIEQDDKVLITFLTLDNEVYAIDSLAKEAFLMAVNDFSLSEIVSTCKNSYDGDASIEDEVSNLFKGLVDKKILLVDATDQV